MLRGIRWSVFMTFALLLTAIASFLVAWSAIHTDFAIYWFDLNYLQWRQEIACFVMPFSIVALWFWMLFIKKGYKVRLWLFPMMLLANIIACAACIPGAVYVNEHQDSAPLGNHIYNAMVSYAAHGPNDDLNVLVYDCDRFDFLCHVIYAHDVSDYNLTASPLKAVLIPDFATKTIALQINGKTVNTHPIE
jgi:hypothetical protein